jgi:hypothetical protein
MMSELKGMSTQKRAEYNVNLYNHINSLIDNENNIKDMISQKMSLGHKKLILYNETYQRKINYSNIINKMVIDPYTDTIKHRIKQLFPECSIYLYCIEYSNVKPQFELVLRWGNPFGCFV